VHTHAPTHAYTNINETRNSILHDDHLAHTFRNPFCTHAHFALQSRERFLINLQQWLAVLSIIRNIKLPHKDNSKSRRIGSIFQKKKEKEKEYTHHYIRTRRERYNAHTAVFLEHLHPYTRHTTLSPTHAKPRSRTGPRYNATIQSQHNTPTFYNSFTRSDVG